LAKSASNKPATMDPPPHGAHLGERSGGLGLGLIIGVLLGLLIGAIALLVFKLQSGDTQTTQNQVVTNEPTDRPTEVPRPTVSLDPLNELNQSTQPVPVPEVTSTSPTDGANAVPVDADIVITFSGDMDPETLTAETVSIFNSTSSQNISSLMEYSYRQDSRQLTISFADMTAEFDSKSTFEVLLSTGIQSSLGEPLAEPYTFSFTAR
jgi:hypothetical protein